MEAFEFVKSVRTHIVDENIKIYKKLFSETKQSDVKSEYWLDALTLFNSLEDEQRKTFFRVLRQVQVDTLSNLFLMLDGGVPHKGKVFDLVLSIRDQNIILNGDLQDTLLALEEEK